ncbi:Protein kinase [Spraguea lophii 42_110]|uniref:cAMP-dependent protein kinase n=1 Tax=Spraguea lophii (strain 42_110) TaxID=1358809 RepID=S7W896_SPRLO|nr:Protein kinase [Spraguea lophii 42_110]
MQSDIDKSRIFTQNRFSNENNSTPKENANEEKAKENSNQHESVIPETSQENIQLNNVQNNFSKENTDEEKAKENSDQHESVIPEINQENIQSNNMQDGFPNENNSIPKENIDEKSETCESVISEINKENIRSNNIHDKFSNENNGIHKEKSDQRENVISEINQENIQSNNVQNGFPNENNDMSKENIDKGKVNEKSKTRENVISETNKESEKSRPNDIFNNKDDSILTNEKNNSLDLNNQQVKEISEKSEKGENNQDHEKSSSLNFTEKTELNLLLNPKEQKKNGLCSNIYLFKNDVPNEIRSTPEQVSLGFYKSKDCCFKPTFADFQKNYEECGILGVGGSGLVMKIKTSCCNSEYALKRIRLDPDRTAKKIGFIDEEIYFANFFQQFPSDYILQAHHIYKESDEKAYVCYELLNEILDPDKIEYKKDKEKIADIIKHLVLGIAFLHANKIAHLDIKPQNVGLDSNGQLKIFDLGISNKFDSGFEMNTSRGAHLYFPPDYIPKKTHLSYHADWWALGITCYRLIERVYPYPVFYCPSGLNTNIKSKYFQKFENDVDDNLKDFIQKLLEVEIDKRLGVGKNATEDIFNHEFLKNTDIKKLYEEELNLNKI